MKYAISIIQQDSRQVILMEDTHYMPTTRREPVIAERLEVNGYLEPGFGGVIRYIPITDSHLYAEPRLEKKRSAHITYLNRQNEALLEQLRLCQTALAEVREIVDKTA